jgi:hypothetical protein
MATPTPKGIHRYDNLSAMEGPAQMSQIADDVDALVDATKPTPSDLPVSGNWAGRTFFVESVAASYRWSGTAWKRQTPSRGTANFTTDAAGLGSIAHGLGFVPSAVELTPVFTTDAVASVFKPTRGALTSSAIQVVCFRTDTSARLLTTAVSVDWVAWP